MGGDIEAIDELKHIICQTQSRFLCWFMIERSV